jgi:hypothetical protein
MKDIGYYIQLSEHEQNQINTATAWQLSDLMHGVSCSLSANLAVEDADEDYLDVYFGQNQSDRDKLALIRGLCDRIELKLMEAAT